MQFQAAWKQPVFELLLITTVAVVGVGARVAWEGSRDVFHPLIFTGPMFGLLYGWMPFQLLRSGHLASYFDDGQLIFVQLINLLGVTAFVAGCLWAGVRLPRRSLRDSSPALAMRLVQGAMVGGGIGLAAWLTLIIKSGGPVQAFSKSYSGGWDDSGYVRDSSILLLSAIVLTLAAIATDRARSLFVL